MTLATGGGLDTLRGGSGNDQFILDVTGLTQPTSASNTAHQVSVATGGGTNNRVVIQGFGPNITQADLNWVQYTGKPAENIVLSRVTVGGPFALDEAPLTVSGTLVSNGGNIEIDASKIALNGATIDTTDPVQARRAGGPHWGVAQPP